MKPENNVVIKRNWKHHNGDDLNCIINCNLPVTRTNWINSNVQEHWNCLENIIVNSVDQIAPLINVGSMQRPVLASQSCDYLSYYFVF